MHIPQVGRANDVTYLTIVKASFGILHRIIHAGHCGQVEARALGYLVKLGRS